MQQHKGKRDLRKLCDEGRLLLRENGTFFEFSLCFVPSLSWQNNPFYI
jgi:hypothetical protein